MTDLTSQDSHFAFGENWREFSKLVNDGRIADSDAGLAKLFPPEELIGKRVIDIGCGSGLPALSMLRAGAGHITCVDIDPDSVETARILLSRHAPHDAWSVEIKSVFDLEGTYDIVYSWGVLHHTGDMWPAIDKAASLVRPGGLLAIALYAKTPMCGFWRSEKRLYRRLPRPLQAVACATLLGIRATGRLLRFRNPMTLFGSSLRRGMSAWHDQHDWLGGYPYESATPDEVRNLLTPHGFVLLRQNLFKGSRLGLLGVGCNEYVFQRAVAHP